MNYKLVALRVKDGIQQIKTNLVQPNAAVTEKFCKDFCTQWLLTCRGLHSKTEVEKTVTETLKMSYVVFKGFDDKIRMQFFEVLQKPANTAKFIDFIVSGMETVTTDVAVTEEFTTCIVEWYNEACDAAFVEYLMEHSCNVKTAVHFFEIVEQFRRVVNDNHDTSERTLKFLTAMLDIYEDCSSDDLHTIQYLRKELDF